MLAACGESSSAVATSEFDSCSKCRITTISWSCGSERPARIFEPPLQFAPGRRRGRRQLPVAQLQRDVPRRLIARQADVERLLAIEAPPRGHAVAAMGVDQPVLRHLPQPQMERHLRILQILLEPPMGFDQHVLRDVASIDAAAPAPDPSATGPSSAPPRDGVPAADRPRASSPGRACWSSSCVSCESGHMLANSTASIRQPGGLTTSGCRQPKLLLRRSKGRLIQATPLICVFLSMRSPGDFSLRERKRR